MKWAFSSQSTRFLGLALATLLASGALLYLELLQFRRQSGWVRHTQTVLEQSGEVFSLVQTAETNQRGYLLTQDESYLQPYNTALQNLPGELRQLRYLTHDNPRQQERIDSLESLISMKLIDLQRKIELQRKQGLPAAQALIRTHAGQRLTAEIQKQIAAIKAEEDQLLTQRTASARDAAQLMALMIILCSLISFLLVALASFWLNQDLIKRQQIEQKLRESEARYRLLFESNPHPMWVYDADTLAFLAVNDTAIERYGYSRSEFLSMTILDIGHPEDIAAIKQSVIDVDGTSLSLASNWRHRKRDGSFMDVEVIAHCIPFDGHSARLILANDITRRKQAEEALRQINAELEARVTERTLELEQELANRQIALRDRQQAEAALRQSEAKFRSLSEHSPVGIFMLDADGNCTYVNPRCQEIAGCTPEQALGNGWLQFVHSEDRERMIARRSKLPLEEAYSGEMRYLHPDGTVRFGRVYLAPIQSQSEAAAGYVGTLEDITESREIEQMKDEFISVVSHELRTPLSSIRGSLGLLAAGVLDNQPETAKQMLQIAAIDTERLVRLVNDILDLDRLESSRVTLAKQWCNAANLMNQSIETMKALAEANQIQLVLEPLSMQIYVAPDRIIQTFVNLLSNAIKFSPPDSTVWLRATLQEERLIFQIQDQGRGIPPDRLETIFGRFQQVDASDSRQKGGTGLGLAICRSIVQQHGGRIWVESTPGEGSSFFFTLPIPID